MTYRMRTLVAGLALAAVATTTSATVATPGANGHGATVIHCSAIPGSTVNGVAVLTPGAQTYQGDPACIAIVISGF